MERPKHLSSLVGIHQAIWVHIMNLAPRGFLVCLRLPLSLLDGSRNLGHCSGCLAEIGRGPKASASNANAMGRISGSDGHRRGFILDRHLCTQAGFFQAKKWNPVALRGRGVQNSAK